MENLVKIAEGVLTSCLAVKPGEEILVITDDSRKEIGEAIYEAAGNLGCEKILMVMKEREVSGQEPPKAIAEAMKAADVVIAPTAQSLTHTNARIEAAKAGSSNNAWYYQRDVFTGCHDCRLQQSRRINCKSNRNAHQRLQGTHRKRWEGSYDQSRWQGWCSKSWSI